MNIRLPSGDVAVVDDEDAELVRPYKWHLKNGYVGAGQHPHIVLLHRLVMGDPPGLFVDHRDGCLLDCRKSNLRPATHLENAWNTHMHVAKSECKGVRYDAKTKGVKPWKATITVRGHRTFLGSFRTQSEAECAFNQASRFHRGEFTRAQDALGSSGAKASRKNFHARMNEAVEDSNATESRGRSSLVNKFYPS